jgi:ferredoxin--NADP+ reductase
VLSKPNDGLDRILAITDAKAAGAFRAVVPSADAAPRHRFRAPEVPMRELGFRHLGFSDVKRLFPIMPGLLGRMLRSGRYYREGLPQTRTPATPELLAEVEAVAAEHGAIDVAYLNEVHPDEIFQGLAIPAPGVIVFTVEMDPEPIAVAPSFDTFVEVASGYRRLAIIAEAICDLLQAKGHAAYPGTALGGQTDYVKLACRAGMGGIGYHGLLLTPQAGARVRIATVYTNLSEMPERGEEAHRWVQDFCSRCQQCVRNCPPQAIHPTPQPRDDGVGTACIEHSLCRDYFAREFGCAVCIKVCPFSKAGYDAVKEGLAHVQPGLPTPVDDRPFQVAVVGAGAAGFYTTMGLLERTSNARIDLLERLPMPHGLVRYGVAPDHPEVRSKAFAFDAVLRDPRVRFFGNVAFGTDVRRDELLERYDAVVYATGASRSRSLGVPGEDLVGSVDAPAFVGWYNAHPDHRELDPPLDAGTAVIVGAGNVALDVARMLASTVDRLETTDMADHAIAAFADSEIREVVVVARRGPAHAAFTPRELHDLAELPGVAVDVEADLDVEVPQGLGVAEARRVARNLALLRELRDAEVAAPRVRVRLLFGASTLRLEGEDGRVTAAVFDVGGGQERRIDAGLVVRAIGFRSSPLPGLPFDAQRAVLPTREGRLLDEDGTPCPGEYACGWVRRGPRGIIGTNKVDADEVVGRVIADLAAEVPEGRQDLAELLASRDVRTVDAEGWDRLRREEHLRGSRLGRVARRRAEVEGALDFLDAAPPLGGPP